MKVVYKNGKYQFGGKVYNRTCIQFHYVRDVGAGWLTSVGNGQFWNNGFQLNLVEQIVRNNG